MSPVAQRIAIAKFSGWKFVENDPNLHPYYITPKGEIIAAELAVSRMPDYLNDLNAIHQAEEVLDHDQRNSYINILDGMPDDSGPVQHDFQWCCATAAQRSEAFLKTIGKWEDGK